MNETECVTETMEAIIRIVKEWPGDCLLRMSQASDGTMQVSIHNISDGKMPEFAKCQRDGCDRDAEGLYQDRQADKVVMMCKEHGLKAVQNDQPEYQVACPQCGCTFGVH